MLILYLLRSLHGHGRAIADNARSLGSCEFYDHRYEDLGSAYHYIHCRRAKRHHEASKPQAPMHTGYQYTCSHARAQGEDCA